MLINLDYPALNAKMKGMYANNLKKIDYDELLRQTNLKDAIYYLKIKFPNLENLTEDMHRKEIEQELNNIFIYDILKLIKYLNKNELNVFMSFLLKYKLNYIKNVFRNITTDSNIYIKKYDTWVTKIFKNINAISNANDEKEFLEAIKDEEYYKIFKEYEDFIDEVPIEEIEAKLDIFYFEQIYKLIHTNKSLEYLIGTEIDLLNIIWIYRAKNYFNYTIEEIKNILIPINYKISKSNFNKLLNCANFEEIKNVLNDTTYKNVFKNEQVMEYDKNKYMYEINLKLFKTKIFDICTVFCNVNLIDIEIKNIINIIEGIRYNLDRNEIQKKIII